MSEQEITFDRYFIAVWRAKWLIIIVVLLASAATWWLAERQPSLVGARSLIKIGRVWKEPIEDPYVTEAVLNGPASFQAIAVKLGVNPSHLKRRVHSEVLIAGTRKGRYPILLSIDSTAESADEAVRIAQGVSDEVIARHEKLFDEAMAPFRERQKLIETQLKESAGLRDLQSKLELELNTVKSNNLSPTMTERTHLVEPIVAESSPRPSALRSVAKAALVTALASVAVAAVAGHFQAYELTGP